MYLSIVNYLKKQGQFKTSQRIAGHYYTNSLDHIVCYLE